MHHVMQKYRLKCIERTYSAADVATKCLETYIHDCVKYLEVIKSIYMSSGSWTISNTFMQLRNARIQEIAPSLPIQRNRNTPSRDPAETASDG